MIKKNAILKVRMNGEGNDPAKVVENATSLLKSYGHTDEEIAELGTADAAKVGTFFTARLQALEDGVIARKGKDIASKAELNGKKYAYEASEKRIRDAYKDAGIELTDDELVLLDEKTRIEGLAKLAIEKVKAANPGSKDTPDAVKEWQTKYEGALKGQTEAQKAVKEREKQMKELEDSIPLLKEKLQTEFFVEQNWKAVALDDKILETLTLNDKSVLTNIVTGHMASNGHMFSAEKTTDGKLRLTVTDKNGNPVQMSNSVGNHTPESYVAAIYDPLVKKSNAGGGTGGGSPFQMTLSNDDLSKMDPNMRAAAEGMSRQIRK